MTSLFTVLIAGVQYLIHPQKLGTIQETINPDAIIPVTLLTTDEIFGNVEATLRLFDTYDDVFIPEFGSVLVEKSGDTNGHLVINSDPGPESLVYHLAHDEGAYIAPQGFEGLPSGPYILHGPNLYQAWRLYEDEYDAFAFGVFPVNVTDSTEYRTLDALSASGSHKAIPVPSKLYSKPANQRRPLSNVRLTIPDAVALQGVPRTLSSKAWSSIHDSPSEFTATFAQHLINLGAVIVGTTKSSQFDIGLEWTDANPPWNPRADGYQSPSGPSAGAGAVLAGYDWLQRSVGLDGLMGARNVARREGLYSLRTSHGLLSLNGASAPTASYDALALSTRLLDQLLDFAQTTLPDQVTDSRLTTRLLLPIDLGSRDASSDEATAMFIHTLENFLGIVTQPVNITSSWLQRPPPEAEGQGLLEYLGNAFFTSQCHEFYHQYAGFRADYLAKFDHAPFVGKSPQFCWEVGKNASAASHEANTAKLQLFTEWFDANIMALSPEKEIAVMIIPQRYNAPTYRNDSPEELHLPQSLTLEMLGPLFGTPELVSPFAQYPFESTITAETDFLPISASVMGPRNSDKMLVDLVKRCFEYAQWRTRVDTGSLVFPTANNPRNVDDRHVPDPISKTG